MIVVVQRFDHVGLHQVQKPFLFLYLMKTCVVETLYHHNHCLLRECSKLLDDYISETVAMSLYDIFKSINQDVDQDVLSELQRLPLIFSKK